MIESEQTPPEARAGRLGRVFKEWKTLALLGGPILVAQLAQMGNGVIDTVMAGHFAAQDLAAVGIAASLWVPLYLFFLGVLGALQPTISRLRGAGQPEKIIPFTWQGLYIAAVAALAMIVLLNNVQPVLRALQLEPVTAAITQRYLAGFTWGVPAMLLMGCLRGLTDGLGHTRVFMLFSLLSTALNLPLNYVLIYGKLGLPALGGAGCGWATAIANACAVLSLMLYLKVSHTYRNLHLLAGWVAPRGPEIAQLLKLGLPIGFTVFVEVSLFSVIALFLAPLGPTVVAGHQIVLNVTSLTFMLPLSLGMALTLRISFLVGAGALAPARLLAFSALGLALGIACLYAPILLLLPDAIARLYTDDPAVRQVAAQLLILAALFQLVDALQVAAIGALRGYHDTRVPMFIMLLSFWVITLPLGYALTFTDFVGPARGARGFWMALSVGLSCACVLLTWRLIVLRPMRQSSAEEPSASKASAPST